MYTIYINTEMLNKKGPLKPERRDNCLGLCNISIMMHVYTSNLYPNISLVIEDLFDVMAELTPVTARWKQVGLALRLNPARLDVIQKENRELDICVSEALTLWLNKCYNTEKYGDPSWKLLAKAVGHPTGGNNRALAINITEKHAGIYVIYAPLRFHFLFYYHQCTLHFHLQTIQEKNDAGMCNEPSVL